MNTDRRVVGRLDITKIYSIINFYSFFCLNNGEKEM